MLGNTDSGIREICLGEYLIGFEIRNAAQGIYFFNEKNKHSPGASNYDFKVVTFQGANIALKIQKFEELSTVFIRELTYDSGGFRFHILLTRYYNSC